jgi:hypothetical protein
MDRAQAKAIAGALLLQFAGNRNPEDVELLMERYADHLEEFDYGPAELAVRKLEATATFLPRIAEVRQAILDVTHPAPEIPDADEAWGEVLEEIRRVGWMGTPMLSPLVRETVRNLAPDWQAVCAGNPDFLRPNFLRLYETCLKRQQRERNLLALPADVREALTPPLPIPRAALEPPPPREPAELVGAPPEFSKAIGAIGRSSDEPSEPIEVIEARRAASVFIVQQLAKQIEEERGEVADGSAAGGS